MMSEAFRSWTPQGILWELGASFVDATADSAASVIETGMERVARLVHGLSAGIWRIDAATMQATSEHQWFLDTFSDPGDGSAISTDPTVRDAVLAGGGLASVDLEMIVGEAVCEERGWTGGKAVVAVIHQSEQAATVLVIGAKSGHWDEADYELIQGFVVLLRQFNGRVLAEQRLAERRRLGDLTISLAARFQTVSSDTLDAEVEGALRELRSIIGADSVVLIDVLDEETIGLPYMVANTELQSDWRTIPIPDISRIPGAESLTLGEFVSQPRVLDVAELVDALMGPEISDSFGLRKPPRRVALLPASVAHGKAILAVVRLGDEGWLPEEFDALSTLASLIAQMRGRVLAERSSGRLFDAQRALAATGKAFLEVEMADAAAAVHETLDRIATHLGADRAVITLVADDPDATKIVDCWSPRDDTKSTGAGAEVTIEALIRGTDPSSSRLSFTWLTGDIDDPDAATDLVNATADLIGQLNVRIRAEREVAARLTAESLLSDLADGFLGASLETFGRVIDEALARLGEEFRLDGVAIRGIGPREVVVESVWAPAGMPHPAVGETIPIDLNPLALGKADFARAATDSKWKGVIQESWGSDVSSAVWPISVGGLADAVLIIVTPRRLADHETEAFRAFSMMLGQLRGRIAEEHRGLGRLAAQRLLSDCAAELAEATPEDCDTVIESVLATAAAFCELEGIGGWQVDHRHDRYLRSSMWLRPDHQHHDVADVLEFGSRDLFDGVRATGRVASAVTDAPSLTDLCLLAIPRGGPGEIDHILLAGSLQPGPWPGETIELLQSLSQMIHEADSRIADQRHAQAAFHSAPIGVVLRDEELQLITCNQAFVDFVGAESVEELIGTGPQFVHADPFDAIDWEGGPDGGISAEASFRGPGGGRVWGQMRGSVVEGKKGEHFWLIHIEDVTERRRAEQLLRFQATHDELTGLANRRQLLDEIHRIAAGAGSVAVLLLDLDRFKNVNDSLGHDRGDELLVVVADRLRLAVRPGDLVARLGGDEFAVVLPGPVVVADAEFLAERLMRLIGEPVTLGRQKIYPTVSIGIAVADDKTAVDDLIRRADTAMYRAKAEGRARAESFDQNLQDAVTARMATESGLRGALRSDELLVYYQPEVSLLDGRILGAEALVRWDHPENGLLPAAAFIEVAEETGLVVEMGEFVLAEACREAARWPGGDDGPMIRVNLAAAQLKREDTVSLVRSVLGETGLAPHRLCLEITESAVMTDVNRSEEILHRLKNLGLHLAVDDFGTGFSSLAYLKRFPVDALKIDRSFVNDLGRDNEELAFVRSIVSLADALGLDVVAEGVETQLQAEILVELGCHRAQGYLFGRPGPAEALRGMLADYAG